MSIRTASGHSVAGVHPRGGGERQRFRPRSTIFSGFLPLGKLRYLYLSSLFFSFLPCGRSEETCSTVMTLHKVYISHPSGHYRYIKKNYRPPPLEKILGAPLLRRVMRNHVKREHVESYPRGAGGQAERRAGGGRLRRFGSNNSPGQVVTLLGSCLNG